MMLLYLIYCGVAPKAQSIDRPLLVNGYASSIGFIGNNWTFTQQPNGWITDRCLEKSLNRTIKPVSRCRRNLSTEQTCEPLPREICLTVRRVEQQPNSWKRCLLSGTSRTRGELVSEQPANIEHAPVTANTSQYH
jgi:hypothetical protein